jgi:hypothetical protein
MTILILGSVLLVTAGVLCALLVTGERITSVGDFGMCAPARYEPLTRYVNPADHIAPMERYRPPLPARAVVVPWQVDDLDDVDELVDIDGWDGELPDDERMPQPRHVALRPAPAIAPLLPVVAPPPAPVAVPDWPAPVVIEPERVVVPEWLTRPLAAQPEPERRFAVVRVAEPERTAPAVVEPEPVPVVVNHTAARFGALEIRRD